MTKNYPQLPGSCEMVYFKLTSINSRCTGPSIFSCLGVRRSPVELKSADADSVGMNQAAGSVHRYQTHGSQDGTGRAADLGHLVNTWRV